MDSKTSARIRDVFNNKVRPDTGGEMVFAPWHVCNESGLVDELSAKPDLVPLGFDIGRNFAVTVAVAS